MRAVRLWSWEYCRANIDPAAREGASDRQERGAGLPTTGAVFLESEISVLGWCKSHLIHTHTQVHTHTHWSEDKNSGGLGKNGKRWLEL